VTLKSEQYMTVMAKVSKPSIAADAASVIKAQQRQWEAAAAAAAAAAALGTACRVHAEHTLLLQHWYATSGIQVRKKLHALSCTPVLD
jgi:hypothetical protein